MERIRSLLAEWLKESKLEDGERPQMPRKERQGGALRGKERQDRI